MKPEKLIKSVLKSYPLGDLKSFEALKQGFANENYKIVTGKGTFLFRISRQQLPENLEKEHMMLEVLKNGHFPTAYPVSDKAGNTLHVVEGLSVSLYDFVEGETPCLNPKTVAEVAGALALLHTTGIEQIPEKQNIIRPEDMEALIREFPDATHPMPDIFAQFKNQWERVRPYLNRKLPTGLIHGDVFPDNTLFAGNKLKAIIDFEEFCIDTLLFDVAMCINGFCFVNNRLDQNLLEIFLQAYNQKRPLKKTEKELLPHYIRWTALGMVSWHLQYHLMFKPNVRQEKRVRELLKRAIPS